MIRNDAVAIVKQVLGFRSNLDTTIVTNMQNQQTKLELMPTKPWFLLSELSYRPTEVGEQRLPLPVDFLTEYEEGCLFYLDGENEDKPTQLVKDTFDVLTADYKDEEPGPPEAYALTGNYFRLFPVPDAVYTLKMLYYKKAALLITGDTENEWLKYVPELLIGKTGSILAASLRDFEAVKVFNGMISENMQLLENQNEARKHDNYDMQMGGPQ